MLGQQKMLCRNCKAVLKIALKCPACDGLMAMPFIYAARTNLFMKLLQKSFLLKSYRRDLHCPVCDYKAEVEKFDRVVVYKEEYSVIC
jgi:RNA polymerase subunit RPABC4/transcription elongation factor Spt4